MEQLAAALTPLAGSVSEPLREETDSLGELDWLTDATREFWPPPPVRPVAAMAARKIPRRVLGFVALAVVAVLAGAAVVLVVGGRSSGAPAVARNNDTSSSASDATASRRSVSPTSGPSGQVTPASEPSSPATSSPSPPPAPPAGVVTTPSSIPASCPGTYDEAATVGIAASCAETATAAGNSLQVGSLQWVVGGDGDVAALGDFDCDGWLDAVALAHATGEVVVFDAWAGAGQQPTGRVLRVVPGATGLTVVPAGACHRLTVTVGGAPPVEIDVRTGS
jgi:cytoskeletal protein RodZ